MAFAQLVDCFFTPKHRDCVRANVRPAARKAGIPTRCAEGHRRGGTGGVEEGYPSSLYQVFQELILTSP